MRSGHSSESMFNNVIGNFGIHHAHNSQRLHRQRLIIRELKVLRRNNRCGAEPESFTPISRQIVKYLLYNQLTIISIGNLIPGSMEGIVQTIANLIAVTDSFHKPRANIAREGLVILIKKKNTLSQQLRETTVVLRHGHDILIVPHHHIIQSQKCFLKFKTCLLHNHTPFISKIL